MGWCWWNGWMLNLMLMMDGWCWWMDVEEWMLLIFSDLWWWIQNGIHCLLAGSLFFSKNYMLFSQGWIGKENFPHSWDCNALQGVQQNFGGILIGCHFLSLSRYSSLTFQWCQGAGNLLCRIASTRKSRCNVDRNLCRCIRKAGVSLDLELELVETTIKLKKPKLRVKSVYWPCFPMRSWAAVLSNSFSQYMFGGFRLEEHDKWRSRMVLGYIPGVWWPTSNLSHGRDWYILVHTNNDTWRWRTRLKIPGVYGTEFSILH